MLIRLLRDERGQGIVEYALIIALISIVAIVALRLLGHNVTNALNSAAGAFDPNAPAPAAPPAGQ